MKYVFREGGPRPEQVLIGQVWRDKDRRNHGRLIEVIAIDRVRCQAHVRNQENHHVTSVDVHSLRRRYVFAGTMVLVEEVSA